MSSAADRLWLRLLYQRAIKPAWHNTRREAQFIFAFVFALSLLPQARADFTFTRIADTNTLIPGGSGKFTAFSDPPTISGSNIAFDADGSSGQQGIYLYSGSLLKIADKNTSIPGGGTFSGFGRPSVSGANVAFNASGTVGFSGIVSYTGSLNVVANQNTSIPGGTGDFTAGSFGDPSISGTNIVFTGSGNSNQQGLYLLNGPLSVIANANTAVPGGSNGTFTSFTFSEPVISGNNIAFKGNSTTSQQGIYLDSGSISVIADKNTSLPGGGGNFTNFLFPSISGTNVAFPNYAGTSPQGIYRYDGQYSKIADINTAVPGGSGNFTNFGSESISSDNVVFEGIGQSSGLFGVFNSGPLTQIISANATLDSKSVLSLEISTASFDGYNVAFLANFTDGSSGIYVVQVPEPSSIVLLAIGFGLLPMRCACRSVASQFMT